MPRHSHGKQNHWEPDAGKPRGTVKDKKKMSELKSFIVATLTGIAAYLHPIASNVFALVWLLGVNFIVGLLCGLLVYHEDFQWRKMWQCFYEALMLFGVVAFIYVIGKFQGNHTGAIQCVSMVVYAACYFYGIRIIRNLRNMAKDGSPAKSLLGFIYYVLSLEFAKHIPYLDAYINTQKNDNSHDSRTD